MEEEASGWASGNRERTHLIWTRLSESGGCEGRYEGERGRDRSEQHNGRGGLRQTELERHARNWKIGNGWAA